MKTTLLEKSNKACRAFELYFDALNSRAHPRIIEALRLRTQLLNTEVIDKKAIEIISERYCEAICEKVEFPKWRCLDCNKVFSSFTCETCYYCGSENTEEI